MVAQNYKEISKKTCCLKENNVHSKKKEEKIAPFANN